MVMSVIEELARIRPLGSQFIASRRKAGQAIGAIRFAHGVSITPLSTLRRVRVTPGSAPPCASLIVPVMTPPGPWA